MSKIANFYKIEVKMDKDLENIFALERGIFDLAYSLFVNPNVNGTKDIAYEIAKSHQGYGTDEQGKKIAEYAKKEE